MLKSLLAQLAGRRRAPTDSREARYASSSLATDRSSKVMASSERPVAAGEPFDLPAGRIDPPKALTDHFASAGAVTLLLPTVAHRIEFLRSTLDFLAVAMKGVRVVISDHTDAGGDQGAVARLASRYSALEIQVERHAPSLHFLQRLCACARATSTPFVAVHADDDFMLPSAVDDATAFLGRYPDYVACQGRTFFLKLRRPRSCAPKINRSMTRAEEDTTSRIASQCTNFTPTLYALTRREAFLEANEAALSYTSNVVFWQYLSSCNLLAKGKLRVLDSLYYLRLDNPDGWRASLIRQGDKTHWPHLIVSPEFSWELANFKRGLSSALGYACVEGVDAVVDDCCLALVRRAFNPVWEHENAELELLARVSDPRSPEHEFVRYCGCLSLAALTRIHGEVTADASVAP